ncbi:23S rRNA (uracil(1939)-C(5))-methyltransferase RlmD [Parvibium lacunae]|nr:23S rRNA (uracil(1939)-C(5))-methyltransferase RlmD [Parvibium lacunae]
MSRKQKQQDIPLDLLPIAQIESLDMEARGVAHVEGKATFIEGGLPGERVRFKSFRNKPSYEIAEAKAILRESAQRVKPGCPHFGVCGGCSMQHLEARAQVAVKQRVLENNLWHIGKLKSEQILPPVYGPTWGYRFRARLSVRYVEKKGGVLVGFHERKSSYVAELQECHVLPPHVSNLIMPLRHMIAELSIRDRLPQVELAVGDQVTVLVLRNMEPLTAADEAILKAFADEHSVQFWLQPKGPDTVYPFYPLEPELAYTLPEFNVRMPFKPTDFTQVNHQINSVLVSRALRLLDVQPGERVVDLFCGLGNFTLPLATQAAQVVGIEGSTVLTTRAQENAVKNGLADKTRFECRNLFEFTPDDWLALWQDLGQIDRLLIDPPRDGSQAVAEALAAAPADKRPKRIVYVSCNPGTLARDAAILHHQGGYRILKAGVVNMFPHTSHVESMAVFAG